METIDKKHLKVLLYCAAAALVLLLAEVFYFNCGYFAKVNFRSYAVNAALVASNPNEAQYAYGGRIAVNPSLQRASLGFENINIPSQNVSLTVSGSPSVVKIRVFSRDDGEKFKLGIVYEKLFAVDENPKEIYLKLKSRGNLQSLFFEILKQENAELTIRQITLNTELPFNFSFLRFFLLLLPTIFIIVCYSYGWHKISTDLKDKNYKIGAFAVLTAVILFSFFIYKLTNNPVRFDLPPNVVRGIHALNPYDIQYPFNPLKNTDDPYSLLFDAFKKRQFHLDIEPDPKLLALRNPYSQGARENAGAQALHDYAFYKGKYYVYFGAAPVLFIYYPYYWITNSLPAPNKVAFVLVLLSIFFIWGAYKELIKTFCASVNLTLFLFGYLAIIFGSLLFMLQAFPYRYEIAHMGGSLFLAASIMFSFKAYNNCCNNSQNFKTFIYLFFAGAFFSLIAAARPNVCLSAFAFLLPAAIKILSDKCMSFAHKTKASLSFLLPCAAIFALIGYYNFSRFGSPFNFGANYQLGGIYTNTDLLFSFPRAVFHYFFSMPDFLPVFPYLRTNINIYFNSGVTLYADLSAGIALFPLVWCLFLWPKANEKYSKNDNLMKMTAIFTAAGTLIHTAVLYGFGGVVLRYTCDLRISLFLLAGLFALIFYNNIESKYAKSIAYKSLTAVFVLSIFFGFCLIFGGNYEIFSLIQILSPEFYEKVFNLFV